MNNIKKIGVSALAGSLAMVSAHAVEYTMTGGMVATYSQATGAASTTGESGNGVGTATDLSFNASGELDNGFTVGYFMSVDTDAALANTSSQMTIGLGSLGTLQINNKGGSKANAIDDITPNAYNETWDGLTASSTNNNPSFFGSRTASGSIDYRIPAQEAEGFTVNAALTYDPNADLGSTSKGGVSDDGEAGGALVLQVAHESGLEIGGGVEIVNSDNASSQLGGRSGGENATGYIKYAQGGLSLAYQEAYQDSSIGNATAALDAPDKEAVMMSVAYTMGDMTFSYAESEVTVKAEGATAALPTIELDSIQAAYVMGAMTVSAAISSTDNSGGVTGDDYTENQLAVSFAF
jgi:outer membrane protein OmpU